MFYRIRSGYRRIKRFISWVPILWKDEDWDYVYLYEIMRFKIFRIRCEIERNKRHVGYQRRVREMKIAEELLARMAFSNFYDELFEGLEAKIKKDKCFCPATTWTSEPYKYDAAGKPVLYRHIDLSCDYCKQNRKHWFERQESKQQADSAFLFTHLKKHVRGWWD